MTLTNLPQEPAALSEALLAGAVERGATDIHFAPVPDGCMVRARVDGLLRDLHHLNGNLYPKVISRLKVLAEIDIAEKRRPQDGRFSWIFKEREVDFRVSAIPTLHGESLVLRVLERSTGLRKIEQLGLSPKEVRLFRSLIEHSSGIIVVTGPTGSGKTTTLYAALLELATPEQNVMTIEDPIEYEIPRVLQTAVHQRLDVTFAALLRGILRHDPDIIMVGEVRDAETAEVSVRAALTGHLVLTSLHTQRAANAISVLLNFGIKPYALAPALRGVLAQQLIREICPSCKTRFEYGESLLGQPEFAEVLREGEKPSFSIGLGCPSCFHSGYRGRRGIFEILPCNATIQKLVLDSSGPEEIENSAVQSGMITLRKNGFRAVLEGLTTVEEVVRAIPVE